MFQNNLSKELHLKECLLMAHLGDSLLVTNFSSAIKKENSVCCQQKQRYPVLTHFIKKKNKKQLRNKPDALVKRVLSHLLP